MVPNFSRTSGVSGLVTAFALAVGSLTGPDAAEAQETPRRVIAMIVANGTAGQPAEYSRTIEQFRSDIFKFGDDTVLLHGTNADAVELSAIVSDFRRHAASADVAIVYFSGQTAHGAPGHNYLVPHEWNGDAAALVDVGRLISDAERVKSGAVLFIDTPPKGAVRSGSNLKPGLTGLEKHVISGKVQIAYAPAAGSDLKTLAMLATLSKEARGASLKLVRLAALAQEDVGLESGGHYVPRVTRGTYDLPELAAMTGTALESKAQRCTAEIQRDTSNTTVASTGEPEVRTLSFGSTSLSASPRPSRRYCPFVLAPAPRDEKPTDDTRGKKAPVAKAQPKAQTSAESEDKPRKSDYAPRRVAEKEPKWESKSEPRSTYRAPPPSSNGNSAARAAAGSVPGSF